MTFLFYRIASWQQRDRQVPPLSTGAWVGGVFLLPRRGGQRFLPVSDLWCWEERKESQDTWEFTQEKSSSSVRTAPTELLFSTVCKHVDYAHGGKYLFSAVSNQSCIHLHISICLGFLPEVNYWWNYDSCGVCIPPIHFSHVKFSYIHFDQMCELLYLLMNWSLSPLSPS